MTSAIITKLESVIKDAREFQDRCNQGLGVLEGAPSEIPATILASMKTFFTEMMAWPRDIETSAREALQHAKALPVNDNHEKYPDTDMVSWVKNWGVSEENSVDMAASIEQMLRVAREKGANKKVSLKKCADALRDHCPYPASATAEQAVMVVLGFAGVPYGE